MRYHLISASLVAAAVILETLGFASRGVVLLGVGVACEPCFWMKLARRRWSVPIGPSET
jgi:hypothetical protein